MSKQFVARLLRTDGCRSRPFHSSFGASLLKKFGWTEGEGLGKTREGMAEPIQIRRREEALGLGHEGEKGDPSSEWGDWWRDSFNEAASKIKHAERHQVLSEEDDSTEDEESPSPRLPIRRRYAPRGSMNKQMQNARLAETNGQQKRKQETREETEEEETEHIDTVTDKSKKRKGRKQLQQQETEAGPSKEEEETLEAPQKRHKSKKTKRRDTETEEGAPTDDEQSATAAAAEGEAAAAAAGDGDDEKTLKKKRKKRKRKFQEQQEIEGTVDAQLLNDDGGTSNKHEKKNKKYKTNHLEEDP